MEYKYKGLSGLKNKNITISCIGKTYKVNAAKFHQARCNFERNMTPKEISHPDDSSLVPKKNPKKKPKHKGKKFKVVTENKRNKFTY